MHIRSIKALPRVKCRRWTLRKDNRQHYHSVVPRSESPLYLELFTRETRDAPVYRVGLFELNLRGLLADNYIRSEPEGSESPELRIRIVNPMGEKYYVQINNDGPRFELPIA